MLVSNALIGLREGLEAGMLITILVAFLNGSGRRRAARLVWLAVVTGICAAAAAGAVLALAASVLNDRGQALFGAGASAVAIALITWMIFWMRHSVNDEWSELEQRTVAALRLGPMAVFAVAFATVLREGLEAAVFVVVLSRQGGAAQSVGGLLLGLATAALMVWMLNAGLLRISLARLFTVTGPLLAIVAAGVLAHALSGLQDVHVLPGASTVVFDASRVLPPHSFAGELVAGLSGISARPTVLAMMSWGGYLVGVLTLFRLALRRPAPRATGLPAVDQYQPVPAATGERR